MSIYSKIFLYKLKTYLDDFLNKSRVLIPYCSSGGKGNSEQEAEGELDDVDDDDGVKQRRKHFA